jgi:hypothetical protein
MTAETSIPSNTSLDNAMRKIAALLETAESYARDPKTAETAATYRAKAESLIRDYRVKEENLLRTQVSASLPISRDIPIGMRMWETHLSAILQDIVSHVGARIAIRWEGGSVGYAGVVVGYDMDIRLAEMIFSAAKLAFLATLDPTYDASLSDTENIYRLRSSGMDRQAIAEKVFGQRGHSQGIRVGRIYAEQCALRGEEATASGRGFSRDVYREAFAREFVWAIDVRLQRARDAADSVGGALVLPERKARVDEAFYALFPNFRPPTEEEKAARKAAREAEEAEAALNPQPAPKVKPMTAARRRELNRKYGSRSATAASRAAEAAAGRVDLARAPQADRIEDNGASGTAGAIGG